jgi:hypothetical protein
VFASTQTQPFHRDHPVTTPDLLCDHAAHPTSKGRTAMRPFRLSFHQVFDVFYLLTITIPVTISSFPLFFVVVYYTAK